MFSNAANANAAEAANSGGAGAAEAAGAAGGAQQQVMVTFGCDPLDGSRFSVGPWGLLAADTADASAWLEGLASAVRRNTGPGLTEL